MHGLTFGHSRLRAMFCDGLDHLIGLRWRSRREAEWWRNQSPGEWDLVRRTVLPKAADDVRQRPRRGCSANGGPALLAKLTWSGTIAPSSRCMVIAWRESTIRVLTRIVEKPLSTTEATCPSFCRYSACILRALPILLRRSACIIPYTPLIILPHSKAGQSKLPQREYPAISIQRRLAAVVYTERRNGGWCTLSTCHFSRHPAPVSGFVSPATACLRCL